VPFYGHVKQYHAIKEEIDAERSMDRADEAGSE
jgi:hypothetical protein